MCCIQISGEILLRNVLASQKVQQIGEGISIGDIEKCGIYLENNLPGYVECENDPQVLCRIIKSYGFSIDENEKIDPDEILITRDKCNSIYPNDLAEKIEEIVDTFFERNLYAPNINIMRMKYVCAC